MLLGLAIPGSGVCDLRYVVRSALTGVILGIKVQSSWTYNASFYFRFPSSSTFSGKLNVALQTSSGRVLASKSVTVRGSQTEWTHVDVQLKPTITAPNTDNLFVVTIDGERGTSGTTINFAMFSLFPPTFKNRPNGMRIDIAEVNSLKSKLNDHLADCRRRL